MPSPAFLSLRDALREVTTLGRADPSKSLPASLGALEIGRVIGRARIVLLSSHFERYFYAVNEDAVAFINKQLIPTANLPETLKLLHSKRVIDELAETGWEHRSTIASIDAKTDTFFVVDPYTGKRSYVGVVRPVGRPAYLRTHADGDWNDNLLSLNQCPI
jgi:hypothetical protein